MAQTATGTLIERYERGARLRKKMSREKHADLRGRADRDPVAILAAADRTRVPELVPARYERMLASPFAFLRGAAAVMAEAISSWSAPCDAFANLSGAGIREGVPSLEMTSLTLPELPATDAGVPSSTRRVP